MNKLITILLSTLFAGAALAASHAGAPMPEAMKSGDAKAQAAAQAKTDAKPMAGDKSAMQPEAMKSGSEKAQTSAEMKKTKKTKKAKTGKKGSTDEQMGKDAKKL